jgi:hypothetical protein
MLAACLKALPGAPIVNSLKDLPLTADQTNYFYAYIMLSEQGNNSSRIGNGTKGSAARRRVALQYPIGDVKVF